MVKIDDDFVRRLALDFDNLLDEQIVRIRKDHNIEIERHELEPLLEEYRKIEEDFIAKSSQT